MEAVQKERANNQYQIHSRTRQTQKTYFFTPITQTTDTLCRRSRPSPLRCSLICNLNMRTGGEEGGATVKPARCIRWLNSEL